MKKLFLANSRTPIKEEKRILKKFYLFAYFHLNLRKMKGHSAIVINVTSARIILYLIINASVRLLVECTVQDVQCKMYGARCSLSCVTALILLTLFLVRIVETSM